MPKHIVLIDGDQTYRFWVTLYPTPVNLLSTLQKWINIQKETTLEL